LNRRDQRRGGRIMNLPTCIILTLTLFFGAWYYRVDASGVWTAESGNCTLEQYQALSYHPVKNDVRQPLLLGMPSSGVVWMRDILEQVTRKYGGTVGHANGSANLNYQELFPYGTACNAVSQTGHFGNSMC
jgi:hypothetical protein